MLGHSHNRTVGGSLLTWDAQNSYPSRKNSQQVLDWKLVYRHITA